MIKTLLLSQDSEISSTKDVTTIVIIGPTLNAEFKALIARGLNTYDQAHPQLKELYDQLEHGKILQNYHVQGLKKRKSHRSEKNGNG